MIKNTIGVLVTSTLVLGLAACNVNDSDRAFDPTNNDKGTRTIHVRNNDNDLRNNNLNYRNRIDNNKKINISSSQTSLNSNNYPQTIAQLVQDAEFKDIQVGPEQAGKFFTQNQKGQNQQDLTQNQQAQPQKPIQTNQQQNTLAPANISQYSQQVIDLTNKERTQEGLSALKADSELSNVAQKKSQDMQQNHYFSHTSPTYGSPFDMMRDFGVTYNTAGENIAQGQQSPQEVVNAWMNSSGHRENILNKEFTHIGVGFENDGNHWSQMFIGK